MLLSPQCNNVMHELDSNAHTYIIIANMLLITQTSPGAGCRPGQAIQGWLLSVSVAVTQCSVERALLRSSAADNLGYSSKQNKYIQLNIQLWS